MSSRVACPTRDLLVMQCPARKLTHIGLSALPYIASTDRTGLSVSMSWQAKRELL